MTNRTRRGTRDPAAWPPRSTSTTPLASGQRRPTLRAAGAADADPPRTAVPCFLRHQARCSPAAMPASIPPPCSPASRSARSGARRDDRLREAEGIIHWDRGDVHLAMPCFKTPRAIPAPGHGPHGRSAAGKGRSLRGRRLVPEVRARLPRQKDCRSPSAMFQALPGSRSRRMRRRKCNWPAALEQQLRYPEAAAIYWKHRDLVDQESPGHAAHRRDAGLPGPPAGRPCHLLAARALHPQDKALASASRKSCESMGKRVEAAQAWADVWTLDAADSTARNRAIAHLGSGGSRGRGHTQAPVGKGPAP